MNPQLSQNEIFLLAQEIREPVKLLATSPLELGSYTPVDEGGEDSQKES